MDDTWEALAVATLIEIATGAFHSVNCLRVFASTNRSALAVT